MIIWIIQNLMKKANWERIKNKEDEHFRERNIKDQEIKYLRDKLSRMSLAQVNK